MRFLSLLALVIVVLSGCDEAVQDTYSYIPAFMYANVEGKYYIASLGATEQFDIEFQRLFDDNMDVITGYYENKTPEDKELNRLQIKSLPVYLIFDTKQEVLRTDSLIEVTQFLSKKKSIH
jgi:hypothetical protein